VSDISTSGIEVVWKVTTGNSRLSGIMGGGSVTDNPKPRLKQKKSKHGTKWI
jgi:hypothetical protein